MGWIHSHPQSSAVQCIARRGHIRANTVVICGRAPHAGDRHRSGIDFVAEQGGIIAHTALLLHVSPDHLRSQPSSQLSVLTAFKKNGNHNLRITTWSKTNKPAVIFKLAGGSAL